MTLATLSVIPFDEPKKNKIYVQSDTQRSVTMSDGDKEDDENQREQWGGNAEFLLACLGNAVGLGNIWRFPYLAYKNGGGAFVIPYIIMVFLIGLPLFIVELSLGQYSALGPAHVYGNLAPILKDCLTLADSRNNVTLNNSRSSAEEFFNNRILGKSSGIDELGTIQWQLLGCLLVAWIVVCFALIKGIQSSGKAVYFTATFPYVVLILLFFRGITLEGAWDGIYFYVVPEWSKLSDTQVWRDAAIQVFYSFGIAGGGMLTFASYNKFNEPILKHSLIIGFGDMLTSLFAGFVIFSMLGFMAHTLNKPVAEVVSGGFGLAFIAIPDGLSQMSGSIVWSVLYFFMLFLLGIDSQFAMIETVTTYIFDTFRSSKRELNKPLIVSCTCILLFIMGIPYCTSGGIYILELIDHYAAGFPYLCIAFLETIIVSYTYGISKFLRDLESMTEWKPSLWLKAHFIVIIATVCPIVIGVLLFMDLKDLIHPEIKFSSGDYIFPAWTNIIGWFAASIPLLVIPGMALQYLFVSKKGYTIYEKLKLSFTPTELTCSNAKRFFEKQTVAVNGNANHAYDHEL